MCVCVCMCVCVFIYIFIGLIFVKSARFGPKIEPHSEDHLMFSLDNFRN